MKAGLIFLTAAFLLTGCGKYKDSFQESKRSENTSTKMTILEATKEGNTSEIKKLLLSNADANSRDRNSWTPLHYAAKQGNLETVKLLLQFGAEVDATDYVRTPLLLAIKNKHKEVLKMLIDHGADPNIKWHSPSRSYNGLHLAVQSEDPETVRLLIRAGANLEDFSGGGKPLHIAVRTGKPELVEILISEGADINGLNCGGDTPLEYAIALGKKEIEQLLLSYGALTSEQLK